MGYAVYENGKRFAGYGVPAICEHPNCNKEIDRGMAYACGGEPFSEEGCDRYFCSEHLYFSPGKPQLCERCLEGKEPFDYKPEKKEWIEHILKDDSWNEWRIENPDKVEEIKKLIK